MPAQFFTATDDKPTGTGRVYKSLMTFLRRNEIQLSGGIPSRVAIQDAIGESWDAIGGNIPDLRANVTGDLNAAASDLEIALINYFCLREKFLQYGATLPGGGGP